MAQSQGSDEAARPYARPFARIKHPLRRCAAIKRSRLTCGSELGTESGVVRICSLSGASVGENDKHRRQPDVQEAPA